MLNDLTKLALSHINDIICIALEHKKTRSALVVYDQRSELASILEHAYKQALPEARFINFDTVSPEYIREEFMLLKPADLVVLIQSSNFRLEAFRIRVELFKRGLGVIEHPHLERMKGLEISYYIQALAYEPSYYRRVGPALKAYIDKAQNSIIASGVSGLEKLYFDGVFEPAKLNIGDYSAIANLGGQFPIGEVFSEAQNLEAVHGRVAIFAFGDTSFRVNKPEQPIILVIKQGRISAIENSTPEFDLVIQKIREDEGEVWVRELGFGMNRAFTLDRIVSDVGSYERMCGIHLSLGAKHGVYNKPHIKRSSAKYHVDVFVLTHAVILDDQNLYKNGSWII